MTRGKWVPAEPTRAMNDAYIEEVFKATDDGCASLEAHKRAYAKMLEAAPGGWTEDRKIKTSTKTPTP